MVNKIIRGTTPNIECFIMGDVTAEHLFFSIGADMERPWFTVKWQDMDISFDGEKTKVSFKLTQEQTLICKPGNAIAQIRSINDDGFANASNAISLEIIDILKDGVVAYE